MSVNAYQLSLRINDLMRIKRLYMVTILNIEIVFKKKHGHAGQHKATTVDEERLKKNHANMQTHRM